MSAAVPVSVVIISHNAAATIEQTLRSACQLSDDITVVDSGSTDNTLAIAGKWGAKLLQVGWQGFGANKNAGNAAAKYDWVLSIDSDEELSEAAVKAIRTLERSNANVVYKIKRINYLNGQRIHFGEWRNDWTIRLFNRQTVRWDDALVHERLLLPSSVLVSKLGGTLHHYTAPDISTYNRKLDRYASLVAAKYFADDEKGAALKIYISPVFSFFKFYILHAGWLDKKAGWQIAIAHARYTFKKYKKLNALRRMHKGVSDIHFDV